MNLSFQQFRLCTVEKPSCEQQRRAGHCAQSQQVQGFHTESRRHGARVLCGRNFVAFVPSCEKQRRAGHCAQSQQVQGFTRSHQGTKLGCCAVEKPPWLGAFV
jgi:hypothetical protein